MQELVTCRKALGKSKADSLIDGCVLPLRPSDQADTKLQETISSSF